MILHVIPVSFAILSAACLVSTLVAGGRDQG